MSSVSEQIPVEPAPPEWGATASPKNEVGALHLLGELLQNLLIAGILILIVNLATARIRVDGSSMEPSLHDGELVVVNRLAYRWSDLTRGDIIVFNFPFDPDRRFIKRLIGLPGDRIMVQDGRLYINNAPVEEPYIAAPPVYRGTWTVGPDEVFVLGDNRNNSSDSQNWGMLPINEIIGKAVMVYWPVADVGVIPHYTLAAAAQ
jgi:signal peptidase I